MLDKPQLELIKGLIDMNLGEDIEEFEKPSTVIRDPIAPVWLLLLACLLSPLPLPPLSSLTSSPLHLLTSSLHPSASLTSLAPFLSNRFVALPSAPFLSPPSSLLL